MFAPHSLQSVSVYAFLEVLLSLIIPTLNSIPERSHMLIHDREVFNRGFAKKCKIMCRFYLKSILNTGLQ